MRYLFFFTLIMAPLAASAQLKSNQVFVEGAFSYSRLPQGPGETNNFLTLIPSFGFQLSDKTALIAGIILSESQVSSPTTVNIRSFFSFFAGVRKFIPITERFFFFGQGVVGYGDSMGDSFGATGMFSANGAETVFLHASPGLMYFPTPRFAVTARIGSLGYKFGTNSSGSVFEVNGGSLRLGLLYRFGN